MSDAAESIEGHVAENQPAEVENTNTEEGQEPDAEEQKTEEAQADAEDKTKEKSEETVEEKYARLERENKGLQKAINRKTAAAHKANEMLQREQQEKADLLKKLESFQTEKKEPDIDDFDTHEEYVNALVNYRAEEKLNLERQEQVKRQQAELNERQERERLSLRSKQEEEYRGINPMYDESVREVNEYVQHAIQTESVSEATAKAIVDQLYDPDSEAVVPAVIDYFGRNGGENIEQLERISKLSPTKAAVEIYKIQQSLKDVPKIKKESKPLPAPKTPVKGVGTGKKDLHKGDVLKNLGLK